MQVINIHEAKTHLSRLVEMAAKGEPFIIAKAGKPMVKVAAIEPEPEEKLSRVGFMKGQLQIPDDFDRMFDDEIEELFGLKE